MAKGRRLNREVVVKTAVSLANEAGSWQPLTLTELAAALDVRVPSLYNHVAGQEGLRQALAQYGLETLLTAVRRVAIGKVGSDALIAIAHAYRAFAQANPGIYDLLLSAPAANPAVEALGQELIDLLALILETFGLQGEATIHAIRGFRSLLHGFVLLEKADGFRWPLSVDESFDQLLGAYLRGLQSR